MLSFVFFEGDGLAEKRLLRHAHLVGPDDVPVAGEIRFDEGLIRCVKTTSEAAGLSLQIDLNVEALGEFDPVRRLHEELDERAFREEIRRRRTGGPPDGADAEDDVTLAPLGVLTLHTCLLPERERPYLLSLELARHRLMLFLNKLEEWQLFDLPPTSPIMQLFELARVTFTEALVAQRRGEHSGEPSVVAHGYSAEAHRLALRALWLGIEASERLCMHNAAREFEPRMSGATYQRALEESPTGPERGRPNAPVLSPERVGVALPMKPAVGCAISPSSFAERAQTIAARTCDFVTMPMRWIEMEPSEGKYFYQSTDRWIEWAVRRARLPVVAGPIIDFRQTCVPEWLYIWENDYETLRELVYEHVKNIVTRYRRTITRWTIVSGLHTGMGFNLTFDQMMDLTRVCVLVVRKLHPTAKVQVEITQPWGEYYTENRRALPPMLYAEMLTQAGITVDAFSLRVQMGQPECGQSTRDLMAFSGMLDRYAALDKPLSLSAVGAPSGVPEAAGSPELASMNPGYWRAPWSDGIQADWLTAALSIALAKPYIQSVCWQELYDLPQPAEMPRGGLLSVGGTPKPAAERLGELRDAVRASSVPQRLRGFSLLGGGRAAIQASQPVR